jgi:hypothetical protein
VKSPVMKALVNATLQEQELRELALRTTVAAHLDLPPVEGDRSGWPLFKTWCEARDIAPYPARPAAVAFFIIENGALGVDELSRIVKSISLVHENVADPTATGAVPAALNRVAPIEPPRSWPKDFKVRFQTLPYEIQMYLAPHEREREKVVSKALSDASRARKELAAIQQPAKQVTDGIQPQPAA